MDGGPWGGAVLEAPDAFRPVLMWFWNATPEKREIRRQIGEIHRAGIREFFVHPAYGLEIPYLSEAYFEAFDTALQEARRLDMRLWLYDEYAWPSGSAGGTIIRDHPEERARALLGARFTLAPGESVALAIPGVAQPLVVRILCGTKVETLDDVPARWVNDSKETATLLVFGETVTAGIHPAARWRVDAWNQHGTLDACSASAVRRFLDSTHERYRAHFGADFGRAIPGVFTDEPILNTGWILATLPPFIALPWYRGLVDDFRAAMGYCLLDRIHELALPVGNFIGTRCAYWQCLARRFGDTYFGQVHDWCRAHGLALTGHVNAEEDLVSTMLTTGDWCEALQWFDVPGVDNVLSRQQLGFDASVLPAKQAASLASQTGRARVLCETYTGSGWNTTMLDMKQVFDRLAVLGVNQLQLMGGYYSVKGFRKLPPDASWPPSHLDQNSLWPHYARFSEYVARVCGAMARGRHDAEVALLYPITSAWGAYQLGHAEHLARTAAYRRQWEGLTRTYTGLANALLETQTGFEVVFDQTLAKGTVVDGRLRIGPMAFSTLILPACTVLKPETFARIEEFAAAGGRVLFVNGLPAWLSNGQSIRDQVTRQWQMDVEATNLLVMDVIDGATDCVLPADILPGSSRTPNVRHLATNCLTPERRGKLRSALTRELPANARLHCEPRTTALTVHGRIDTDGSRCLFLVNAAPAPYEGWATIPGEGSVMACAIETGQWTPLDPRGQDEGERARIALPAHGAVLLRWGPGETQAAAPAVLSAAHERVLDGRWTMTPRGGNFRPIDFAVAQDLEDPASMTDVAAWPEYRFTPCIDGRFLEGVPPQTSEGNGWGIMEGTFPLTGFAPGRYYWLRGVFTVASLVPGIQLVTEDLGVDSVSVNGRRLALSPGRWWDGSNLGAALDGVLKAGTNTVLMRLRIPNWEGPHALPLTGLVGPFVLDAEGAILTRVDKSTLGDWRTRGFPYYAGAMSYETRFVLGDTPPQEAHFDIEGANDVVEVALNGISLGKCLWPPYRFPVQSHLRAGDNTLVVTVTNCSANRYRSASGSSIACATGPTGDARRYRPLPAGLLAPPRLRW